MRVWCGTRRASFPYLLLVASLALPRPPVQASLDRTYFRRVRPPAGFPPSTSTHVTQLSSGRGRSYKHGCPFPYGSFFGGGERKAGSPGRPSNGGATNMLNLPSHPGHPQPHHARGCTLAHSCRASFTVVYTSTRPPPCRTSRSPPCRTSRSINSRATGRALSPTRTE